MNRRKLLKIISYSAAVFAASIGVFARGIRHGSKRPPDGEIHLAKWIDKSPNPDVEVYVLTSSDQLRQLVGEELCKLCHRKFKDHSPQELEEHFYNGGGPPKWQPSSSVLP